MTPSIPTNTSPPNFGRRQLASVFFFNDTATTEIYPLSLHDALPICHRRRDLFVSSAHSDPGNDAGVRAEDSGDLRRHAADAAVDGRRPAGPHGANGDAHHAQRVRQAEDRKSTRLNSSHQIISYPVFC